MSLRITMLCLVLSFRLGSAGQEVSEDKDVMAFWESNFQMYDHWSKPKPGRLEPAYDKLQVVLEKHPTEPVYVWHKVLFLAEMERWSELQSYLEELMPLAGANSALRETVELAQIHVESRQKGLLSAFSLMSNRSKRYFLAAFVGNALVMTLLSLITAVVVRRKLPKEEVGPLLTVMLLMAWMVPVSQLLIVSLVGGLYPIRPYDRYQQEVVSQVVQSVVFPILALSCLRRCHWAVSVSRTARQQAVFVSLAILLPMLGYLPHLNWQVLEAFPQNIVNLYRGINVFFGAFALLKFLMSVGFGLLVYYALYTSIRSLYGAIVATVWLLIWLNVFYLPSYLASPTWATVWSKTCFSASPIFAYEAWPSRIAPIATLWWMSLLSVVYGIACSGGWNPSLML